MRGTPRMYWEARPTSATLRSCASFIPIACYAAASDLMPRWQTCAPIWGQRERLVEYAAAHIPHMQKALVEMNLQLHHVVFDVTGAKISEPMQASGILTS